MADTRDGCQLDDPKGIEWFCDEARTMFCPEKVRLFSLFVASVDDQKIAALRLTSVADSEDEELIHETIETLQVAFLRCELAWNGVEQHRRQHGC